MGGGGVVAPMISEEGWEGVDDVVGFIVEVDEAGLLDRERTRTSVEGLGAGVRAPRYRAERIDLDENGRGDGQP